MTRASLGLCLPLLAGCASLSSRNAPGNIEVERPPRFPRQRHMEIPDDPGQYGLAWTFGGLGGLASGASFRASVETSAQLYTSTGGGPLSLGRALGVNLGWSAGSGDHARSDAYVEAQLGWGWLASLAGGWAWEPSRHLGGPQVTGSLGPFYVRTTTLLTSGTTFEVGIVLKVPLLSFTWSR